LKWWFSDAKILGCLEKIIDQAKRIIDDTTESVERKTWAKDELQKARAAQLLVQVRRLDATIKEDQ
jgi:hypothetical protein